MLCLFDVTVILSWPERGRDWDECVCMFPGAHRTTDTLTKGFSGDYNMSKNYLFTSIFCTVMSVMECK